MKKILFEVISLIVFAAITLSINVSAESVQTPNFDINGNKCGTVIVYAEIERDVQVLITQHTEEGDYDYYDSVIPCDSDEKEYRFILEGKDDASYTVKIGVSKYRDSDFLQYYEDEFTIYDVDEIKTDDISGYQYKYSVYKGEELSEQKITIDEKDQDNIVHNEASIYFPTAEYVMGDANSDNIFNIRDAAHIAICCAKGESNKLPEWADYNNDGIANIRDAAAIAIYLAKRA